MTPATIVTGLRIALAPAFYLLFTTTAASSTIGIVPAVCIVVLFLIMEITDALDGAVARKTGTVSDFGKLFDPFADSLARLTYFFSFVMSGLMPGWVFILVLYRDLGVSFVRILAMRKGVAMAAQLSGKIKAWVYAVAGGAGIAVVLARGFLPLNFQSIAETLAQITFYACAATAVWTMIDYALAYRRLAEKD
ncbi:MAG: CDP-diacylglycerol--glycerol-3-phosphate 3-phosphatidyltransferase [Spirochaetales bacterium]|nr:CDP-diacylglycerol--glycerol-3-phosphate 3-phosphatidyltransferase [Spirochaetales bacterium]MBP7263179.1 CDP-diacylglycerol--glycerol-3-phosphate 3-phosphatidyltransferase [Spirochaetia bacterium]